MSSSLPPSDLGHEAPTTVAAASPAHAQKQRTGIHRIVHAAGFSISGLRLAWQETAFRQEAMAAGVLVPLAFWLGSSWLERSWLAGCVILVMIVELLNTAVESAIDRVGPEWHELSKRAKDIGSAAVLLSLLLCALTWASALWSRLA